MRTHPFDRQEHVYRNPQFVELIKDAVRFFNGTPVHPLSLPDRFLGAGVYAIYYTGNHEWYSRYAELNRLAYNHPIYVGKAVPKGHRQGRLTDAELRRSSELCHRLRQRGQSIKKHGEMDLSEFHSRFVIFEDETSDMIGAIEAALIRVHRPLWNAVVDGFGNHDPGKGRYKQAMSDWDVLHPGRKWALKCEGVAKSKETILAGIGEYWKKHKEG